MVDCGRCTDIASDCQPCMMRKGVDGYSQVSLRKPIIRFSSKEGVVW